MNLLFLHGLKSTPGGLKQDHGLMSSTHLPDDFGAALTIAQAEFDQHQPDVLVGSSRGGAVAMNIDIGDAACASVPGMENLGYGHDGEAEHHDPPFGSRRDRAHHR